MDCNGVKRLALLGATGSIGDSVLSLVDQHPDSFDIVAISANVNVEKTLTLIHKYRPAYVAMGSESAARLLQSHLSPEHGIELLVGQEGIESLARLPEVDTVVAAIVGAAGLSSTYAAVQAGKRILLANKEALVVGGHLIMPLCAQTGAILLPLDSEHNALFQCMPDGYRVGERPDFVKSCHLTASGGPFWNATAEQLATVRAEDAVKHPNWSMGAKISVDSASLMNKGLELIEAKWLFNLDAHQLEVVIHPQSIVHSLVEYVDGSFLAQWGAHDMRIPIAHALFYPDRKPHSVKGLSLKTLGTLDFLPPDHQKFPCLALAQSCLSLTPDHSISLNAANEIAVDAFLKGFCGFADISTIVEKTMERVQGDVSDLAAVLALDKEARRIASDFVNR